MRERCYVHAWQMHWVQVKNLMTLQTPALLPPPPAPTSNMLQDRNGTAVHAANVLASYSVSMCMSGCIRCHKLKLDLCY